MEELPYTGQGVYFIQSGNFIKIGNSFNPKKRLKALQIGNPKELKLVFISDRYKEHELQNMFRENKVNGEWYSITDEMMDFIENEKEKQVNEKSEEIYELKEKLQAEIQEAKNYNQNGEYHKSRELLNGILEKIDDSDFEDVHIEAVKEIDKIKELVKQEKAELKEESVKIAENLSDYEKSRIFYFEIISGNYRSAIKRSMEFYKGEIENFENNRDTYLNAYTDASLRIDILNKIKTYKTINEDVIDCVLSDDLSEDVKKSLRTMFLHDLIEFRINGNRCNSKRILELIPNMDWYPLDNLDEEIAKSIVMKRNDRYGYSIKSEDDEVHLFDYIIDKKKSYLIEVIIKLVRFLISLNTTTVKDKHKVMKTVDDLKQELRIYKGVNYRWKRLSEEYKKQIKTIKKKKEDYLSEMTVDEILALLIETKKKTEDS